MKSGYSAEAISYVTGLLQYGMLRPQDLWLTQSGGDVEMRPMPAEVIRVLNDQDYYSQRRVRGISVV